MDTHLAQAALNAVDVVWWTDHDWRMEGVNYRDVTHFTSFRETGATGQGGKWSWSKRESGPATSASTGGIVSTPCSPNDPVSGGALHVAAQSRSTRPAKFGYYASCGPSDWNYRNNLAGRAWCGSLSAYRGALDLLVDGSVPMGAVSVSGVTARQLVAVATGLPAGSTLQILQGAVDYAGQNVLTANTALVGSYSASQLGSGSVTQAVDTSADSFLRTQVVSAAGAVIATSNPV